MQAQPLGEWNIYPSYMCVTQCVAAGNTVYALADGNLFSYDTEDTSIQLFDCQRNLNDVHIATIAYCPAARRMILVYDNGNIDLLDTQTGDITNIDALKRKAISNKTVNNVCINGTTAYICTGFGFISMDVREGIIRDTYQIGLDTRGILVQGGTAYLATDRSVYSCSTQANWHLAANWQLDTANAGMIGSITNQTPEYAQAGKILWHAEKRKGMVGYKLNGNKYEQVAGPIQPNSPAHDLFYRMNYVGDRLLVAGGINTYASIYNDPTAMYFQDGEWTTLDFGNQSLPYPITSYKTICNVSSIVQDPNDPAHHFASAYRTGLFEFRDGKLVRHYDSDNSPLRAFRPASVSSNYRYYTTCNSLRYDADGNLWMANEGTDGTIGNDTILRVLQPNGRWLSLYYPEIEKMNTCDDIIFTSSGINFVVSRRMDRRGFFGFHTNGTLTNMRDDRHTLRTTIINEDGTRYAPDEFYCMTEDLDGQVWCGTQSGLFVIEDPTRYFDNDFHFLQIKIPRNDGSGLADYLLNGVSITCIAVDGGNRKWIGTSGNGVYLISADGQEMIHHFQADSSPLISDEIQSIAINPTSGVVMIGTDRGLCSYTSDATEAQDELSRDNVIAYPNPVNPDYTGPIAVRGLSMDSEVKITNSTGQLIWSGTSNGGTFTWNGCNHRGQRVGSGVYQVIANNREGKKAVVTRIIVIR